MWEITECLVQSDMLLKGLLAKGWEPFSVLSRKAFQNGANFGPVCFLRRKIEEELEVKALFTQDQVKAHLAEGWSWVGSQESIVYLSRPKQ